ncbi:MAG: UDP-N-acetylglucosamine 4,6-dehydratase family protein [Minisyncoccia bacterium]|jgi:FlaA1/EpsC-like NDP-sugar epimerase
MEDDFKNKVVLITGGTGSIGSEIVRQLLATNVAQVRIYSRDEHKQYVLKQELGDDIRLRYLIGDIRDKDRLDFAFRGVDICFHAAALKHVPICEYNPFEAVKTNVVGTQNVVEISIKHNLEKVVAISTDKAVAPESVLGASKLMMERLITAANVITGQGRTRFSCVRFGNVLNSRGSVIELWRKQIEAGGPLTITHRKATRYFMGIPEAVSLIFDAARLMEGGEIFVLKMKRRPIVEFAKEVIQKFANGKKIKLTYIGLRPGEKMHEALLTADEISHTLESKDMFIVLPGNIAQLSSPGKLRQYPGTRKARRNSYVSNS